MKGTKFITEARRHIQCFHEKNYSSEFSLSMFEII